MILHLQLEFINLNLKPLQEMIIFYRDINTYYHFNKNVMCVILYIPMVSLNVIQNKVINFFIWIFLSHFKSIVETLRRYYCDNSVEIPILVVLHT